MNTVSGTSPEFSAVSFGRNDRQANGSQAQTISRPSQRHRSRLALSETGSIARNLFEDTFVTFPSSPPSSPPSPALSLEQLAKKAQIPNGVLRLNPEKNGVISAGFEVN